MSDDLFKDLDAQEARLREQLAAIERARLERAQLLELAAKHNFKLVHDDGAKAPIMETLADLGRHYLTDPASPIHKHRFVTRAGYERNTNRIIAECGDQKIATIGARDIQAFYDRVSDNGAKASMGHGLITMLRILAIYGAHTLEHPDCKMLAFTLHNMDFAPPKPRKAQLTLEHVIAIIRRAHERKRPRPSIALAQALQFECKLRQKDVIGEWVPQSEPGTSDVIEGNEKWVRGLRWSDIKGNILTHAGREVDLNNCTLVMTEIGRIDERKRVGAVIKYEKSEVPYQGYMFRRLWRQIADEAGVPNNIWNTDVPSGARSEKIRATEEDASVARK